VVPPPRAAVLHPCKGKLGLLLCPHHSMSRLFLHFRDAQDTANTQLLGWEGTLVSTQGHPTMGEQTLVLVTLGLCRQTSA